MNTDTPDATHVSYDQPDWAAMAQEVKCPLCDYNLRGLTEPRCPECGYAFLWRDLLDPSRREHSYLFELRPSHNFSSFWKTAYQGLFPRRFWTTLRPDQRSVPRRLAAYAFIVGLFPLLALASAYGPRLLSAYLDYRAAKSAAYVSTPPATYPTLLFLPVPASFEWPYMDYDPSLGAAAWLMAWPCLTFLSLMIFQVSMRRAKLNNIHVVRCIIYSWDCVLSIAVLGVLLNLYCASMLLLNGTYSEYAHGLPAMLPSAMLLAVAPIYYYRLSIAYLRYLKFRHALATVFASQLIVFLFMATVFVLAGSELRW